MISLRSKISQMLIMGFSGTELDCRSPVSQWLQKDALGGVLLFDYDAKLQRYGKNLVDQTQIKHLIYQLNTLAAKAEDEEPSYPLFIAIDYEGGKVDRLAKIEGCKETIPAFKQARLSEDAFVESITQMAECLQHLGFNLNFAPVVDLNLNQQSGIIGRLNRSFSDDPHTVYQCAKLFARAFNQRGIICAYKHFPGHGSATGDSHEDFVDVSNHFHANELLPYEYILKSSQSSEMIMTAHVVNRTLDATGLPATLSHEILTNVLRKNLGFTGVIVSDDLQMSAISRYYSLKETLTLTINAGADMLIFANQLSQISATEVIDQIEHLVQHEIISSDRINEAYSRIVRLKAERLSINFQHPEIYAVR